MPSPRFLSVPPSTLEIRQRLVFALNNPNSLADVSGLKRKLITSYTSAGPVNPSRVDASVARAGSAPEYIWLKRQGE